MHMGPLQVLFPLQPTVSLSVSKLSLQVLLPPLLLLLLVLVCPPLQAALPPDFVHLLDFKREQASGVQENELGSWNEGDDQPCEKWVGVSCDVGTSSVWELILPSKQLAGALSTSLGRLASLERLDLANNYFSGSIPWEIGNAKRLVHLDLSNNTLTGSIPINIGQLQNLQHLLLFKNSLSGTIPSLQGLTRLHKVDLSLNQLEGPLPDGISSLHNLWHLNISFNHLNGTIPADICNGSKLALQTMDLSSNELHGSIPSGLLDAANHSLKTLNLSHNALSGTIPFLSGRDYKYLEVLDLSSNGLNGTIPYDLGTTNNAWQLRLLWLQGNQLTGNIEDLWRYQASLEFWKPYLREVRLQGNQFHGTRFGSSLDTWADLEVLDLSHNSQICLDVALMLRSLENLREIRLGGMKCLNASLPNELRKLGKLEVLDLSSSQLRGEIPPKAYTSAFLPSLKMLNLSNNLLSGAVPAGFSLMGQLTQLYLSGNDLAGPLPDGLPHSLRIPSFFRPGNEKLCGSPLPLCGPTASVSQPHPSKVFIALKRFLAGLAAFTLFIVATCGLACWLSWDPAGLRATMKAFC